jgi:hypothetical protein
MRCRKVEKKSESAKRWRMKLEKEEWKRLIFNTNCQEVEDEDGKWKVKVVYLTTCQEVEEEGWKRKVKVNNLTTCQEVEWESEKGKWKWSILQRKM